MPIGGHRSARRRGMLMGAAISSSRSAKRQAAAAQQPVSTPAASQPSAPAAGSAVEQLKQFAELRDQGILTEEEFAAKKKQILGL